MATKTNGRRNAHQKLKMTKSTEINGKMKQDWYEKKAIKGIYTCESKNK